MGKRKTVWPTEREIRLRFILFAVIDAASVQGVSSDLLLPAHKLLRIVSIGPSPLRTPVPRAAFAAVQNLDPRPSSSPSVPLRLDQLPDRQWATVLDVVRNDVAEDRELALRLTEIGFIPGEAVRIVASGVPGRAGRVRPVRCR